MAHRKIDVDAFDADQFVEDEELLNARFSAGDDESGASSAVSANVTNMHLQPPRPAAEIEKEMSDIAAEVRSLLNKGSLGEALGKALQTTPAGVAPQNAKDKHAQTIMDVLSAFKSADIQAAVKALKTDQVDVLMKYIYRGFASPDKFNPAMLLQWHEKVYESGGLGCIVRVMTDRKKV